jgi:hypothetical protein
MTTAYSDIRASADLAAAEATLKANIGPLSHYRAEPTPTQIAAVVAVTAVIVTATKQQAGWARLRLKALRELGKFLLRTPYLKGRPPKVSTADTLPSLEKLGIKDRRIAWRAIQVALIDEDLFQRYLMTDEPTEKGLHREARRASENYSESEPAWVTPPEYFAELDKEFHFTKGFDPCPYPRPEGFDGLKVSWPQSTYCNPPFRKKDSKDGQGIAAFARKAIEENKLGKDVVLVLPTKSTINFLLEAGAEFRSARRIPWIDPKTGLPATTSPSSNMLAILRGKPVVSKDLSRYNPEEIADLLVAADREKAGEVWRALLDRLASSMPILFFSGHCIENPR